MPEASQEPTPDAVVPRRANRLRRAAAWAGAIAGVAIAVVAASVGFAVGPWPWVHPAGHAGYTAAAAPSARHRIRHPATLRSAPTAHPSHKPAAGAVSGPVDPAFFAPGACVAYPPTKGDTGKTVFLDAGHGWLDPGGVGYTSSGTQVAEAPVNLRIELLTAAILRAHGYRVVLSRTRSSGVARLRASDVDGNLLTAAGVHADVAARDICANKAHANLLVGIYMDAGGGEGSLTSYDPDRPFAAASRRFAGLLQRNVLSRLNADGLDIPNDGVVSDVGLGSALSSADMAYHHLMLLGPAKPGYFTTPSQMPGALIEPLYLTDPFEAAVAASAHGRHLVAAGVARAVEQYFAVSLPACRPSASVCGQGPSALAGVTTTPTSLATVRLRMHKESR